MALLFSRIDSEWFIRSDSFLMSKTIKGLSTCLRELFLERYIMRAINSNVKSHLLTFHNFSSDNQYISNEVFGLSGPDSHIRPSATGPLKMFNQLNLLLFKVQSLWSCAHYFQWFTGYLNHVDLVMSHVATCFKDTALLFSALKLFFGF